jgi:c-di-GMP-binding flagellar brake protein YcgR
MVALLKMPKPFRGTSAMDRRVFPRKEVHAQLEIRRVDNTLDARRNPKLTLYLRDLSLGGMSAISPCPLAQGERLSLHFPRQGDLGGWDAVGHVRRCVQSALGYRVSVEFDPLPAA